MTGMNPFVFNGCKLSFKGVYGNRGYCIFMVVRVDACETVLAWRTEKPLLLFAHILRNSMLSYFLPPVLHMESILWRLERFALVSCRSKLRNL